MFRIAFLTGLVALATPALAQQAGDPPSDPQAASPQAATPETPPAGATSPTAAAPSSQPPAAGRPATPAEVGTMVETEFPSRDGDRDGSLNQAEFTTWLGELVSRSPGQGAPPSEDQIASAFTQTDADGNGSVSPAEMAALLSRSR